jgi:AraC family cel operon transcriptional repressor
MARIPRYRLNAFASAGEIFHIARVDLAQKTEPHRHTFCEVFWIERGEAYYWINGRRVVLMEGDGVWAVPDDAHALHRRGTKPGLLMNLAYPTSELTSLARRYDMKTVLEGNEPQRRFHLAPGDVLHLGAMANRLDHRRDSRLLLAWFLLELFRLNERETPARTPPPTPDWLKRALDETRQAGAYRDGAAGLARRAGKSPEHVNRVIRQCYGKTTTELLNTFRLEHAAGELRMTNRPIIDIAFDSGYPNLGYFYRRFTEHFHRPPRRYRMEERAIVQ